MKKAKIDINHVAKLANLDLTHAEKESFEKQLTDILSYIEQIEEVDTKDTPPAFNVSPNKNVTRPDEVRNSLTQEEATINAANKKDGFIVTKGVFDNE